MAMTDKDNIMIEEFFKQAAQQQIEDNGFTERVMSTTPSSLICSRNSSLPEFIRTKLYFVIFVIMPVPPLLQLRVCS